MPAAKLKLADTTTRRPSQRSAFTKRTLERVTTPTKGDTIVYDEGQRGLAFRVRRSGARAFYLIRKHRGRVVKMKLGDFPAMTVEQARKAARAEMVKFDKGVNPMDDRRVQRGELTIAELWTVYRETHLEPRCSPRTLRADSHLFKHWLSSVSARRLSDLSPASAKMLHAKIGKTSRVSANRAIQLLRRLYRYAARHHGYEGRIPTAGVELFREVSRERFLSVDELPRFLAACDAEGQPWADFFRLALCTGQRRSNVQAARWASMDLKADTWTIPGGETKSGRGIAVPLTAPALEILNRRKAEQDGPGEYVFPALRDKGNTLHLSQPARPFTRICNAAGITGITIHDLRRTAGAWLAASGASLLVIGKALGHADLRATQIYARLDLSPVRVAMEGSTAAMTKGDRSK